MINPGCGIALVSISTTKLFGRRTCRFLIKSWQMYHMNVQGEDLAIFMFNQIMSRMCNRSLTTGGGGEISIDITWENVSRQKCIRDVVNLKLLAVT